MKTIFYITGRRNGKSKLARYEFKKDPKHTAYITLSHDLARHDLGPLYKECRDNIFSPKGSSIMIDQYMRGKPFKRIIIHEYLYFDTRVMGQIHNAINALKYRLSELIIITNSNDLYPAATLATITEHKEAGVSYLVSEKQYLEALGNSIGAAMLRKNLKEYKAYYSSLWDNFITGPGITIIHEKVDKPILPYEKFHHQQKEDYFSEYEGDYIFEEKHLDCFGFKDEEERKDFKEGKATFTWSPPESIFEWKYVDVKLLP